MYTFHSSIFRTFSRSKREISKNKKEDNSSFTIKRKITKRVLVLNPKNSARSRLRISVNPLSELHIDVMLKEKCPRCLTMTYMSCMIPLSKLHNSKDILHSVISKELSTHSLSNTIQKKKLNHNDSSYTHYLYSLGPVNYKIIIRHYVEFIFL